MKKLISIVIIVVLAGGGLYLWDKKERVACESRANELAVSYYPMSQYPDMAERTQLQSKYKTTYIADYC